MVIKSLLIIVLFFSSVSPCTALQVTFKQSGNVDGTIITLGDIARFDNESEMAVALASQIVAQSPPPGESVSLNSLAIKKHLVTTLSLPGSIVWKGSQTVLAKRNGIYIGSENIQELIAEYLRKSSENLPDAEIRFISGSLPIPFILPAGNLTYEVIPSNPGILGSSRFSLIFRVDNRVVKNMSVRGRIEALAPVVVVTRKLQKGTVLSPGDLTLTTKNLNNLRDPGLSLSEFSGKKLTRNIKAGTPISHSMVVSLPVIKRGERVKIVIRSGMMHLSASGIARTDGRRNQVIRVQNSNSKKIIHCRVTAPGLVEVIL